MKYRVIDIKTIPTDDSGSLSFFEENRDVPFDIKRIYYISQVPKGMKRGYHAHKNLKQLLFCPYGEIEITLDDGVSREHILLNSPSKGLVIEETLWREMLWIEDNSALCVAASDYYDADDYIRDYDAFLRFKQSQRILGHGKVGIEQ